jgi:hypothetical protein
VPQPPPCRDRSGWQPGGGHGILAGCTIEREFSVSTTTQLFQQHPSNSRALNGTHADPQLLGVRKQRADAPSGAGFGSGEVGKHRDPARPGAGKEWLAVVRRKGWWSWRTPATNRLRSDSGAMGSWLPAPRLEPGGWLVVVRGPCAWARGQRLGHATYDHRVATQETLRVAWRLTSMPGVGFPAESPALVRRRPVPAASTVAVGAWS